MHIRTAQIRQNKPCIKIFVPIPVQEMVYLKAIEKIIPMDVSVSVTIDQKLYLKKFRGGFNPLSPPWIRL